MIENEERSRPFSDQEIVEKLRQDNGISLARRTVAKYREELKILPARLRKHSSAAGRLAPRGVGFWGRGSARGLDRID